MLGQGHATVAKLLRLHMAAIPFENLDILLGRPVGLDLDSVQAKLVRSRRGGYCFEHALLMRAALEGLGMKPETHLGRVLLRHDEATAARTHLFLTLTLPEGTFIVDPGFGSFFCTVPVPLDETRRVEDDGRRFQMVRAGEQWILRSSSREGEVDGWIARLEPAHVMDIAVGHHYTSTHPRSTFVNKLVVRGIKDGARVEVTNRGLRMTIGRDVVTSTIWSRARLRSVLRSHLNIDVPEIKRLRVPEIPAWR